MFTKFSNRKLEFELLFHKWNRKIYSYALTKTNSVYIAEETVQRTFIKLWNNLENKHIELDINAQLFCITRSILLDIIKEENRRNSLSIDTFNKQESQTPSDLLYVKDLEQKINSIVDAMPEMRQKVFRLSRFENLKHKQIAKLLNISAKTVENHIRLALKTLKSSITTTLLIFLYFF